MRRGRGLCGKIDELFGKSNAFSHMFVYILVEEEKNKNKEKWMPICVSMKR